MTQTPALTATQNNFIPRDFLAGLLLSTAGSSSTFSIAAGQAANSTNVALMNLLSAYTKTTSSWAVGTGNGSLDTGSIANSTLYNVFLIQRLDTLVTDVFISLSATSPTLPTNYTVFRRIGTGTTNSSGQWTTMTGSVTITPTYQSFLSGSSATYSTPAGVKYIRVKLWGAGGGGAGASAGAGYGVNGGNSWWDGSSNWVAVGGGGAVSNSGAAGLGGINSGSASSAGATSVLSINGAPGGGGSTYGSGFYAAGGMGGNAPFLSGGGAGVQGSGSSGPAIANTGSGGYGAGTRSGVSPGVTGSGGGSGGYRKLIILAPAGSYTYTVGTGGAGGTAGSGGDAGGAGADGRILVEEYY